jgi:hypothetical protein
MTPRSAKRCRNDVKGDRHHTVEHAYHRVAVQVACEKTNFAKARISHGSRVRVKNKTRLLSSYGSTAFANVHKPHHLVGGLTSRTFITSQGLTIVHCMLDLRLEVLTWLLQW